MLPDIDHKYFACRQRKQRALPLEVLIFASLATICALDIHHQDVVSHLCRTRLVLGKPYPLGRLPPLRLRHNTELGIEEGIEEGGFSRGLGSEDGDEVVVETRLGDFRKC